MEKKEGFCRAIITGATGAIGTALIKELVSKNIETLVLTRLDSKRNKNIPKDNLVKIRYCSLNELCSFENIDDETYDVFFHLAWDGASGEGRNDMFLQNKNVEYALDAVNLANRFHCKQFIGIGSQAEYGRVRETLKTNTPCFPENGYGIAKYCAGKMTRELATQLGLEHIWVRVLSVYGPNDSQNSLISYVINEISKNRVPKLTKGEQIWDYLYSSDAARALRLIAEKGIDKKTYVLGGGEERQLKEYVEEIKNTINPKARVDYGAKEYSDKQVMYLCADISELMRDTSWYPKVKFKDGIKEIISSLQKK